MRWKGETKMNKKEKRRILYDHRCDDCDIRGLLSDNPVTSCPKCGKRLETGYSFDAEKLGREMQGKESDKSFYNHVKKIFRW